MSDAPLQASQSEAAPEYLMYHEPQAAALCGVHALNSLLQGPYIDEIQCAEIARQLDEAERALMAEAGMDSAEFLKFVAEESANVDNSGMFSVQVLSKALEMWELTLVPLSSPDAGNARAEPQAYTAFICNLQEHWFTVRKIHGDWWNLNSLFSAPEPLSPFYLAAFLGTLQEQGYTIFLVRGPLMEPDPPATPGASGIGAGRWISASEAREIAKQKQDTKQQGFLKVAANNLASMASAAGQRMVLRSRGQGVASRAIPNLNDDDDEAMVIGDDDADTELQRVLAASRQEMLSSQGGGDGSLEGDEDADLAAAIAASLADNNASNGAQQQQDPGDRISQDQDTIKEEKEEWLQILPLPDLAEEPAAGTADCIEVGVKLPSGERKSRRFISSIDTVGSIAAFATSLGVDMNNHRLALSFPRRVIEILDLSLVDAKVGDKDVVFVELKV